MPQNYFQDKAIRLSSQDSVLDFFIVYQEQLANSNIDSSLKDFLGFSNSEYGFIYTKDIERYYKTYLSFAKTPVYINQFKARYNTKKTEKGKRPPNFKLEGIDNKNYTLDDFKGKYTYIDLWASWCSPCLAQIPHLKKLEEKYSETINFVSIAWNDDKTKWKKTIKDKQLNGFQLFANNKNAEFFTFFNVSALPRFILLDKEGKIIESTAIQPSDKRLEVKLKAL